MADSGYSGTPLAKKLGLKSGFVARAILPPDRYFRLIDSMPDGVAFVEEAAPEKDFIHLFATEAAALRKQLPSLMAEIRPEGMIWVSWPKKASKMPTDITEDTIRSIALPLGLVDVKVCAVDEVWSGLKLVIRRENRLKM